MGKVLLLEDEYPAPVIIQRVIQYGYEESVIHKTDETSVLQELLSWTPDFIALGERFAKDEFFLAQVRDKFNGLIICFTLTPIVIPERMIDLFIYKPIDVTVFRDFTRELKQLLKTSDLVSLRQWLAVEQNKFQPYRSSND